MSRAMTTEERIEKAHRFLRNNSICQIWRRIMEEKEELRDDNETS